MSACGAVSLICLMMLLTTNVHGLSLDRGARDAVNEESEEVIVNDLLPLLEEKQIETRFIKEEDNKHEQRGISSNGIQYWPGGVIPYEFGTGFDGVDRQTIQTAMLVWSTYTCVTFRQALPSDPNTLLFESWGSGCFSYVGMGSGQQFILLPPGCRDKGAILRQLGHTIGLWPEQTRPDRDDYVEILEDNIQDSGKEHYQINPNDYPSIPYDYASIMHFSKNEFSKNGQLTIRTKDSKYQSTIGQKHGLSFYDVKLVNLMYQCGGIPKVDESKCKDVASDCSDRLEECPESEMFSDCRKTCNYCQVLPS